MFDWGHLYNSVDLFSSLMMSKSIMSTSSYHDVEIKETKANLEVGGVDNKIKQTLFLTVRGTVGASDLF